MNEAHVDIGSIHRAFWGAWRVRSAAILSSAEARRHSEDARQMVFGYGSMLAPARKTKNVKQIKMVNLIVMLMMMMTTAIGI